MQECIGDAELMLRCHLCNNYRCMHITKQSKKQTGWTSWVDMRKNQRIHQLRGANGAYVICYDTCNNEDDATMKYSLYVVGMHYVELLYMQQPYISACS
jgi:hypothetical protein